MIENHFQMVGKYNEINDSEMRESYIMDNHFLKSNFDLTGV